MSSVRVDAVLLDIDGTIIDSNDAHAHAWVEAIQEDGLRTAFDIVRPLIGMGGDKLLRIAANLDAETDRGRRINKRQLRLFDCRLPDLQPTSGARALLKRIHECGIEIVVATSAHGDEVRKLLRQAGVADLIDEISSSDDAEESKPDPDIVLAALTRVQVPADRAVLVGDTPYDVDAALRAGVRTIALRCGGWWPDEAFEQAIAIFDDPADLLAAFDRSPIGRATEADPVRSSNSGGSAVR